MFETDDRSAPRIVSQEKAAEIAADWVTGFYHVQVGALETQEFRARPIAHWLFQREGRSAESGGAALIKCWSVYFGQIPIKKCKVPKAPQAAAIRAQVLQRTKELGLDFLDHGGALWMFCPAGKVFDSGDAWYHSLFHEYGKNRSKFMWKALENAHPQFQPEFVPSSKTQAYANLLEMLKENPPIDCTEPECECCCFRQQLSTTPESLLKFAQFCLQDDFG